jgi:hypothetical protein
MSKMMPTVQTFTRQTPNYFIRGLFNDTVFLFLRVILQRCQYQDYTIPNGTMTEKWQIGKGIEKNGRGLTNALFYHLTGEAEKKHKNLTQDSWCPARDSNQAPPQHKCRALRLR